MLLSSSKLNLITKPFILAILSNILFHYNSFIFPHYSSLTHQYSTNFLLIIYLSILLLHSNYLSILLFPLVYYLIDLNFILRSTK